MEFLESRHALSGFQANYDFGTTTSPVAAGDTQVTPATTFTTQRGYGWTTGTIYAADRGGSSALDRDFNYTNSGTFAVNAPNGTYQVVMELGDEGPYVHDDMGVFLQGKQFDSVTTAGGQVVTRQYTVNVANSQFTLQLKDLGGSDPWCVIEGLSLTYESPLVPTLSISNVQLAETANEPQSMVFTANLSSPSGQAVSVAFATAAGTATAGNNYTAENSTLTIPAGQTQGTITVPVLGNVVAQPSETFLLNLTDPIGVQLAQTQVTGMIQNDGTLAVTGSTISFAEGMTGTASVGTITRTGATTSALVVDLASSNTALATVPATVTIPTGALTATFNILAPVDSNVSTQQTVTITATANLYTTGTMNVFVNPANQSPFFATYDFGTTSSPVGNGDLQVTPNTTYTSARGFGWTAGTINSGDRGGTSSIERDFNYTSNGTFRVNLSNGSYQVDLLLGDEGPYVHDDMGIFLQAQQVDSVTTAGGQVVSRTYQANVVNGQLTVQFKDLGGSDPWVVVEGMRVRSLGASVSDTSAYWPVEAAIPGATFSDETSDGNGFISYSVTSQYESTANNIRVLLPSNYNPSQQYHIVYVLPVEAGEGTQYGDGLATVRASNLQNTYNAIFVEPTFSAIPWYANNASNVSLFQETYLVSVVVPFIESRYSAIPGPDGAYLMGFSKSGYGAVSLLLRNPDTFGHAVAWDSPLAMSDPTTGDGFMNVLGTVQNFTQNYQITSLLQTRGSELLNQPPRIFLFGYSDAYTYYNDLKTIDAEMTKLNLPHVYNPGTLRDHDWTSGWVPTAVQMLFSN